MATRLYTLGPNGAIEDVIEGVGAATSSANPINITVDIATTVVTDGSGTRVLDRSEVLNAIDAIKAHILKTQWPPA